MTVAVGRRLGSILVGARVLTERSLADALTRQQGSGLRLGAVLVDMGLLDERAIVAALGVQLDLPVADLGHQSPDSDAVARLPEDLARSLMAVPVRTTPEGVEVAVAEPLDDDALARLEHAVGGHVVIRLAAPSELAATIERSYAPAPPAPHRPPTNGAANHHSSTLEALLSDALGAGATDVHLTIGAVETRVRYRIGDGLAEAPPLSAAAGAAAVRAAR
ncbi:MAG: hypothetical protein ACRD12_15010, partial [Acidimicrobiales bacterium]